VDEPQKASTELKVPSRPPLCRRATVHLKVPSRPPRCRRELEPEPEPKVSQLERWLAMTTRCSRLPCDMWHSYL